MLRDLGGAHETPRNEALVDDGSHRHRPVMSEGFRVEDGIDMFVFADGKIRVPTVVHHVQHG